MKFIFFLLLSCFSFFSIASEKQDIAKKSVIAQAEIAFGHLQPNLLLEITSVKEVKNKVYIDLSIGTKRRPSRMNSCFVITIDNNGFNYVSNLEHRWDDSCI